MHWRGFRLTVFGASFLVAATVITGAHFAWRTGAVQRPLESALLQVPGVESVEVRGKRGTQIITVTLGPVPDLAATYQSVVATIEDSLPRDDYRLEVLDRRDPVLDEIYHRLHFSLMEAAQRGTFSAMADTVARETDRAGLDLARVSVDHHRIYLQLHLGEAYRYDVVPRLNTDAGAQGGWFSRTRGGGP